MSKAIVALAVGACLAAAQAPTAASKKSALDKATLEAYVRHMYVWGPQISIQIADPKPAPMAGFFELALTASAGAASQTETFYVSKDGQKILRAQVFDVADNPFRNELNKLKTELSPSMGTPGAAAVIVLFSDFQCSYCKDEAKLLRDNLLKAYPKQVRLYFKDFPLTQIHAWAKPAAIAGRCIFRDNPAAFWDYHDWIFEKQGEITVENLKEKVLEFAGGKGLDSQQLSNCLDKRLTEAEVDGSLIQGRELSVNSTPTMFLNGRRLAGKFSWEQLKQIIDFEIEYQKTAKNAGEDCGCEVKLPSPLNN